MLWLLVATDLNAEKLYFPVCLLRVFCYCRDLIYVTNETHTLVLSIFCMLQTDGYYIIWRPTEDNSCEEGNQRPYKSQESWAMVNLDAIGYKNEKLEPDNIQVHSVLADSGSEMSPEGALRF